MVVHNHRNHRMQLANRSSETFAFLPFCVFSTHPRLGWGKSRFPLECWPHSLLVEKRPSIYIWVDMTPKSEKIGKICTFFFIHPSFCIIHFAKQQDFTTITASPSQGQNRSVSKPHPQKSPPHHTKSPPHQVGRGKQEDYSIIGLSHLRTSTSHRHGRHRLTQAKDTPPSTSSSQDFRQRHIVCMQLSQAFLA